MEKIAVKTKIKKLELGCRKQNIEFKAFDMTSRQVANVDKIIRNNDNEYIRLTIEPEIERMEIEPIVSVVKLVAMECAGKGQHIKIAGFKAAGDKLDQINNYINNESDVIITFEQTQEKLIDETPKDIGDGGQGIGDSESEDSKDSELSTQNSELSSPKDIELNLPPKWNTHCYIKIGSVGEYWQYGFIIKIGNVEKAAAFDDPVEYDTLEDCIYNLKQELDAFIDARENFKQIKPLKKKIEKAIEELIATESTEDTEKRSSMVRNSKGKAKMNIIKSV